MPLASGCPWRQNFRVSCLVSGRLRRDVLLCFFKNWIIKCLRQVGYVAKIFYDVMYIKYWPKNDQILENDFGQP